tara:strand:- start:101 stop:271 length:171 start_codon:yes stop_codon:yes gene_type:complete
MATTHSKYLTTIMFDYSRLNMKSFLDKHGVDAVKLAKKMFDRQKHEQTIDNQTRGN